MLKVKVYTLFMCLCTCQDSQFKLMSSFKKLFNHSFVLQTWQNTRAVFCYVCSHVLYCSNGFTHTVPLAGHWSHTLSFSTWQSTVFDRFFPRSQSSGNTDVYCMHPVLLWRKRKYLTYSTAAPTIYKLFFNCSRTVSRVEL